MFWCPGRRVKTLAEPVFVGLTDESSYRTPVFDIGDTLYPTTRMQNRSFSEVVGEPVTFDPYNYRIYDPDDVAEFLADRGIPANPYDIVETYRQHQESFLEEEGVFDLLRKCNNRFGTIGFISDNCVEGKQMMRSMLDRRGIEFDGLVVSEEVGVEKPRTEIFRAFVLERKDPPRNFAYIGNNAPRDSGAEDVGMRFVWATMYDTFGSAWPGWRISKLDLNSLRRALRL
jgi:FMN phosphatase YigB (HAD superfamily)